jgi:hypothetical protein
MSRRTTAQRPLGVLPALCTIDSSVLVHENCFYATALKTAAVARSAADTTVWPTRTQSGRDATGSRLFAGRFRAAKGPGGRT